MEYRIRPIHMGAAFWLLGTVACSENPAGVVPEPTIPVYGECSVAPNYISDVRLAARHRSFPVATSVRETGGWGLLAPTFARGISQGLGRWASSGDLGTTVVADSVQARVRIRDVAVPPDTTVEHLPLAASFTISVDGFLESAEILFYRYSWKETLDAHASGAVDQTSLQDFVAAVTAHELGHAFGIEGHPPEDGLLMTARMDILEYVAYPTVADLNTLAHAYCR